MASDDGHSGFSELPHDLLAQISAGSRGIPMLAVSRAWRDAVLERASAIQLNLHDSKLLEDLAPAARLPDRACRGAKPGLHLKLDHSCWGPWGSLSTVLPTLLQYGLQAGGWASVHALSLVVREQDCLKHTPSTACVLLLL